MNKCDIQLETHEGVIVVFEIDVDDIETILSINSIDAALEIIFEGNQVNDLVEGDVFFDYHAVDLEEEAINIQQFQEALHDWLNEHGIYNA